MVKRVESQSIQTVKNMSFQIHSFDCINFQTKLQSMRGEKRSVCGLEASHLRRTCSRTGEAQVAHRAHTACTYFEVVRDTAVSRGALSYMLHRQTVEMAIEVLGHWESIVYSLVIFRILDVSIF